MKDFDALMVLGPTASGKTAATLAIADLFPVEIISMDSALVYRGMDIGTAKPSREEMDAVPHHLIDIIEPEESFSAAKFVEETERLIPEIRARGKIPLIVGGTMLYAKALMDGLDLVPSSTEEVRAEVTSLLKEKGLPFLLEELRKADPVTAERLKPADTQRICRAYEVWKMTGRPFSSFLGQSRGTDFKIQRIGLMPSDRAQLHKRIEERFDIMLEQGFLGEVEELKRRPGLTIESPSMRCVGYRQAWEYLDGKTTFEEFRLAGVAATRQLAKRQITWMRSMNGLGLTDPLVEDPKTTIASLLE